MVIKKRTGLIRTVQKSGNSYSMYLPMEWVRQTGINRTQAIKLDIDESGNLILSPLKSVGAPETEKMINITHYDFDFVNRIIGGCYMNGYSKFKLIFKEPVLPKELLKHKKNFDKIGLDVEILETTNESVTFYVNESLVSPLVIFKNLLHKTLNLIRAVEQKEPELLEEYLKEIRRARFVIYRAFRRTVKNPSALSEFNLSAMNCLSFHNVSQHLVDSAKILIKQKLSSEDIANFKKLLEFLLIFASDKDFESLKKCNDLLKKMKNEMLKEELKKVHRELVKWWVGY